MFSVSYVINSVYTSRSYILTNENKEFWIVDCGDVFPLVERISQMSENNYTIKGVLLTHAHFDHIYGLPRLSMMCPTIRVFTNESGKKALANDKLNMSRYHDEPIRFDSDNVIVADDGSEIELFEGVNAKVFYTPGHNPSCITYEIEDYLFTGDSYIPGCRVVTNLPGSDKGLADKSINKIMSLLQGRTICAGHEMQHK